MYLCYPVVHNVYCFLLVVCVQVPMHIPNVVALLEFSWRNIYNNAFHPQPPYKCGRIISSLLQAFLSSLLFMQITSFSFYPTYHHPPSVRPSSPFDDDDHDDTGISPPQLFHLNDMFIYINK